MSVYNSTQRLQFAANFNLQFKDYELKEIFNIARSRGFRYMEAQNPYLYSKLELRSLMKEAGIKFVLINVPTEETFARGVIGSVQIASQMADFLECPYVHVLSGYKSNDRSDDSYEEWFIENLKIDLEVFEEYNVTPCLEPLSLEGYFLNSFEQALRIKKAIGGDKVKIILDYFHAHALGLDLEETTRKYLPHVAHVQVSQKFKGQPVTDQRRYEPFIEGSTIDYKPILNLLMELGYKGHIGLEYTMSSASSNDWITQYE